MKMREQAEDRLRECEEKRKNLESERNAHQDNFPDVPSTNASKNIRKSLKN